MRNKKINLNILIYVMLVLLSSVITSCVILIDNNRPDYYIYLPILPLSFGIVSLLFFSVYKYLFKSIAVTIITGSYFIRMVVIPLVMVFGNYQSQVRNFIVYKEMNNAILLMIYEVVLVFFALTYYGNKHNFNTSLIKESYEDKIIKNKNIGNKLIIFSIIIFIVINFILYPQLKYQFKIFYPTSLESNLLYVEQFIKMKQTVPGIIYRMVSFSAEIIRAILVIFIINILKYRLKLNSSITMLLSLILIMFNCLITSTEIAYSLFMTLAFLILLMKLYPNYEKKLKLIMAVGTPIFVLGILYYKSSMNYIGQSTIKELMAKVLIILQAYFSGPANIATGLYLNRVIDNNKLFLLFSDIVKSVPFISYFFKNLTGTPQLFNKILYLSDSINDQIIPFVSQSAFYITGIFAPLPSIFLIKTALQLEKKSKLTNNIEIYFFYIFTTIIFSSTLVLYNLTIFLSQLLTFILPLYILLNKKRNRSFSNLFTLNHKARKLTVLPD